MWMAIPQIKPKPPENTPKTQKKQSTENEKYTKTGI